MRKMKTNIQYLLLSILAICGMLTSCTEETPLSNASDNSSPGRVLLSYSVGKSIQSRADTDAGWSDFDFNENKVTRLDLYIFRNNGKLFKHIPNTSIVYDADETYNNETETTEDDWEIEGLDPEDINDNDQIYLIANCDAAANIETLSGLQNEVLNGLVCNAKQDKFVMVGAGDDVIIASEGNDIIISVNLVRVAAKICLSFARTTNWTDVSYRFVHHATTSALLKESEANHLATQTSLSTSPSEDGLTEITDQTENLYNDEGTQKLVLYSYANDWYKEGGSYENPDVNGDTMDDDQIYKQEPIDETKQTYILLRAPYNGNYYYYKVPVNYRLPINNDEVFDTEEEWEAFKESYRHLYQLQRNYIYDITVTIDREGGTETKPVTPRLYYHVIPFDKETIEIPAFE